MTNNLVVSVLSVLLTIIIGLLGLLYRDTRDRLDAIEERLTKVAEQAGAYSQIVERLDKSEVRQGNTIRALFLLMSRLHPDKTAIVTETMKDLLVNGKAASA